MSAEHTVLLVEDSRADALVLLEAFADAGIRAPVRRIADGETALRVLAEQPAPRLVILDLNVPRMSGEQILARVRTWPSLQSVPVVVLTGSPNPNEEARCRELGADGFFIKPGLPEEYGELARVLRDRWLP